MRATFDSIKFYWGGENHNDADEHYFGICINVIAKSLVSGPRSSVPGTANETIMCVIKTKTYLINPH